MSPVAQIVRRFELHTASGDDLAAVERAVEAAVNGHPAGAVASTTDRIERPPVVEVQLEGVESAVLDVVARLADLPTARLRNDVMKVRGAGRRGAIYPDPGLERRVNRRSARPRQAPVPESGPSYKGKEVTVAIVDSGLMVDHEVFKGRLWTGPGGIHGKQFIDDKPQHDIRDQDGHGTALAGEVLEGAGDAPVRLLTAKFFDPTHPARPDNAARALRFAVENGAKVIVLAWDVGMGSVELEEAFRAACAKALVVISAGNYGSDNDWYEDQSTARVPVRYAKDYPESTLTVMATDELDTKAWFSNYGRETVDLAAPGVDIATTRRALTDGPARTGRKFRRQTGTSPAAALVAGAAARLMSRYPKLEIAQVRDCLRDSVDKVPGLKCASQGRLNIDRADKKAGTL